MTGLRPAAASTRRQRHRWHRRSLLAWLLLVGVPAGIEYGSLLHVDVRPLTPAPMLGTIASQSGGASFAPYRAQGIMTGHVGNGAVVPVTIGSTDEAAYNTYAGAPPALMELTFELHELAPDSSTTVRKWTATSNLDTRSAASSYPWLSLRVSLCRIAGEELAPGLYRLYVDVKELEGSRKGGVSRGVSDFRLLPAPSIPFPDPPSYRPDAVRMVAERIGKHPAGDFLELRATNTSGVELRFVGDPANAIRSAWKITAAEGEAYMVDLGCASLWASDGSPVLRWSEPYPDSTYHSFVDWPPGVTIRLIGLWNDHGFGLRAASAVFSSSGVRATVASDPFAMELADSATSGPVILWIADMPGPGAPVKLRPIADWKGAAPAPNEE